MLDRNPDQIGGSGKAELVLHLAAIIRHGFVAEANRVGDLRQAVAFAKQPEDLKIAARPLREGIQQGGPARCPDGEQRQFLRNPRFDVLLPGGDTEDGLGDLIRGCAASFTWTRQNESMP